MWIFNQSLPIYLYLLSLITSGLLGVTFYKRLPRELLVICLFLLYTFVSENVAMALMPYKVQPYGIYNLYSVVMTVVYVWCFGSISKNALVDKLKWLIIASYLLFQIYWLLSGRGMSAFPSASISISNLMVIVMALLSLSAFFRFPEEQSIYRSWKFWFSSLVIIYWSSTFTYTAFKGFVQGHSAKNFMIIERIHIWLTVSYYALICIVILRHVTSWYKLEPQRA